MLPEISRRCSSCGASIRERDALFCPECGKPLPRISKASEESAPLTASSLPDEAMIAPEAAEVVNVTSVDEAIKPTRANEIADSRHDSQADPVVAEVAETNTKQKPQETALPAGTTQKREAPAQTEVGGGAEHLASRAHPRMEKTRETLHRASSVARGVIEDEVKRVEKIRHVSSVVIEEASYDPSLRFVLVALGLFVLFLILLVLSKVMG